MARRPDENRADGPEPVRIDPPVSTTHISVQSAVFRRDGASYKSYTGISNILGIAPVTGDAARTGQRYTVKPMVQGVRTAEVAAIGIPDYGSEAGYP